MEITRFVAVSFVMSIVTWVIFSVIGIYISNDVVPTYIIWIRNTISIAILFLPNLYLLKKFGVFPAFSLLYFQTMVFVGLWLLYLLIRFLVTALA